ncbi:type I toxin-antitoxin system Fst family toxin [Mammaliicoccus sciuri]|nr:type I toxin-antitoxin system Fst family toxin [Mammaliicoccus sciuri]
MYHSPRVRNIICGCAIAYFSHWLENRKKNKRRLLANTINKTPSLLA